MHLKNNSGNGVRSAGARLKEATDTILGVRADDENSVYNVRSGALLTFVLLFVAGWIPTLGQIVAGYVGGRRSGSPYRGLFATGIATFCMLVILTIVSLSLGSLCPSLGSDPEAAIASIAESSPFLGQLAAVGVDYLQKVFGNSDLTVNYATYMLTLVFGIIGGVLADHNRKEIRLAVANADKANENRLRSISLFKKGRSIGFESYDDYAAISVNQMQTPPPKKKRAVRKTPREDVVTGTVDTTPVASTPTSASDTVTSVSDTQQDDVREDRSQPDVRPFIDEDISDCI